MCYCIWIVSLDELLESGASVVVADAVDLKRSSCWVYEVKHVSAAGALDVLDTLLLERLA